MILRRGTFPGEQDAQGQLTRTPSGWRQPNFQTVVWRTNFRLCWREVVFSSPVRPGPFQELAYKSQS